MYPIIRITTSTVAATEVMDVDVVVEVMEAVMGAVMVAVAEAVAVVVMAVVAEAVADATERPVFDIDYHTQTLSM